MKQSLIIIFTLMVSACTDANIGKFKSLGESGHVKCYSGDTVIYDGDSTGKIMNSHESDGYYFIDKESNSMVEVSGNCVIKYH
jgi:hypothetical protein